MHCHEDVASSGSTPPAYEPLQALQQNIVNVTNDPLLKHKFASLNLPSGYFMLRNRANGKVLDVRQGKAAIGTEIILYTRKDVHFSEGSLSDPRNNQLFFLDWNGHLCSVCHGLYVDVIDGKPCLAVPTPIAQIATRNSHPPPTFKLDPITCTLHVFHGSAATDSIILEAVPQRAETSNQPANVWSAVTDKVSGFFTSPFSGGLSKALPPLPIVPNPGSAAGSSIFQQSREGLEDEIEDNEDSSSSPMRDLRTICLPNNWREKLPQSLFIERSLRAHATNSERNWLRRQWDVLPVALPSRLPPLPSETGPFSPDLPTLPNSPALPAPPLVEDELIESDLIGTAEGQSQPCEDEAPNLIDAVQLSDSDVCAQTLSA